MPEHAVHLLVNGSLRWVKHGACYNPASAWKPSSREHLGLEWVCDSCAQPGEVSTHPSPHTGRKGESAADSGTSPNVKQSSPLQSGPGGLARHLGLPDLSRGGRKFASTQAFELNWRFVVMFVWQPRK